MVCPQAEEWNIYLGKYILLYTKVSSKWVKDHILKSETLKLLVKIKAMPYNI